MPPDVPKWLEDIRDAAAYILHATKDKTRATFGQDRTLRQAVERSFEVIGEAMNRIGRSDEAIVARLTDHRRIIAFRNILIHGYDAIDMEIVWQVIQHRLPRLLSEVEALLQEEGA